MKRLADIEANEKSINKRSATNKTTRRTQASPKRTAIVNPLPMRKLQKAKSESNSEIDVFTSNTNENKTVTSKKVSKARSVEIKSNEVTFTSPKRNPRKKFETKCKSKSEIFTIELRWRPLFIIWILVVRKNSMFSQHCMLSWPEVSPYLV